MKIVLTGVSTSNKGAELMLYAILQEIERHFGKVKVYLDMECLGTHPLSYVETSLILTYKPHYFLMRLCRKLKLIGFANHLRTMPVPGINYYIDCSGFYFSDQMDITYEEVKEWKTILEYYKKNNVKSIFLPQAFGPVAKDYTKKMINLINCNADIVFAREKVSYDYLVNYGFDTSKLHLSTDFTSLVDGVIPEKYMHLNNSVCVIPNNRMIQQKKMSLEAYIEMLISIVQMAKMQNRKVFLLIHAEGRDRELAQLCKVKLNGDIEIVDGLNAQEVKGMISISYLCISSRFHGVASALNSCVPCLATSWSHKYKELFSDYGLEECLLPLEDNESMLSMVEEYLGESKNIDVRSKLKAVKPQIKLQAKKMWEKVWSL